LFQTLFCFSLQIISPNEEIIYKDHRNDVAGVLLSYAVQPVVEIVYKVKGKNKYSVPVFFSDKNGAEGLTSEEFQTYEHLYFTIQATEHSEREFFKSSDLEENLSLVQLIQADKAFAPAKAPAPVTNPDEKIVKYILSYPKSEVLLHKPFTFTSQTDTSETIGLSDEYFPQFSHYKAIYEEGYELSHDRKFVESFDVLIC